VVSAAVFAAVVEAVHTTPSAPAASPVSLAGAMYSVSADQVVGQGVASWAEGRCWVYTVQRRVGGGSAWVDARAGRGSGGGVSCVDGGGRGQRSGLWRACRLC
jgi:hypothetical protein